MYNTDLIEEILTSESAKRMIQRVTNKYGESYVGLWLFQIIGIANDELKDMVDSFKLQVVPQTATWSLPWWEESLGITTDESLSIEERRQNCIEKKRKRSPMNTSRIEEIISSVAGVSVRMDEYYAKRCFAIYISAIPSIIDEEAVRKKLKEIKQSHMTFNIFYEVAITEKIYCGGAVQKFKEITLREV